MAADRTFIADEAMRAQLRREADVLEAQLMRPPWWLKGFLRRRFLQRCLITGWELAQCELALDGAIHNPHTLVALVMVADSDGPVTAEQLAERFGPKKM